MLFAAPADKELRWNEEGIGGAARFMNRVWRFVEGATAEAAQERARSDKVWRKLHQTVKRVTEDIERFSLHTAIAGLMELLNMVEEEKPEGIFAREVAERYVQMIAPFAPHIAEEMWEKLGKKRSVFLSGWPGYEKEALEEDEVEIVIQVNGKVRDRLIVPKIALDEDVRKKALASPKIQSFISEKELKNVIVVPKKLVNIVVR